CCLSGGDAACVRCRAAFRAASWPERCGAGPVFRVPTNGESGSTTPTLRSDASPIGRQGPGTAGAECIGVASAGGAALSGGGEVSGKDGAGELTWNGKH